MSRVRLAYLVTHPIQYQAPLLRLIAAQPDIALTVFFGSDFSVRGYVDQGFGRAVAWDVPLLDGYDHVFLPTRGRGLAAGEDPSFRRPFNRGLAARLGELDVLWVHGYHRAFHWAAIAAAKARGVKVLVRDETSAISAARSGRKEALKRLFFQAFRRGVDGFLAIGSLNRAYWRALGVPAERIFSMPYAVDNAFFQAGVAQARPAREALRARLGLEAGRPILLFAAKLIERKRPEDLLRAFAPLAGAAALGRPYLLLAGDGALRGALEAQAGADVRYLGFQGQGELAELYGLADLFVLPSEREPWGLVVNEAMNAECAVVASDRVGAAADLVEPGGNGYTFPVGDVAALTARLRQALEDPARLAAMGARSRAIIDRWSFAEDLAGLRAALAAVGGRA